MVQDVQDVQKAQFIAPTPSGIARNEAGEHVTMRPFLNKVGVVLEREDTADYARQPTGYEPIEYLLDFGDGHKLWIPMYSYIGINEETKKEVWEHHLVFVQ